MIVDGHGVEARINESLVRSLAPAFMPGIAPVPAHCLSIASQQGPPSPLRGGTLGVVSGEFVLNCDSFDFLIGMIDARRIIVGHSIMEIRVQDVSAITVSNILLILSLTRYDFYCTPLRLRLRPRPHPPAPYPRNDIAVPDPKNRRGGVRPRPLNYRRGGGMIRGHDAVRF